MKYGVAPVWAFLPVSGLVRFFSVIPNDSTRALSKPIICPHGDRRTADAISADFATGHGGEL